MVFYIFGMLDVEYVDGLFCDVMEIVINNWWIEIGFEYFNIELIDGILGFIIVVVMFGILMGVRNWFSYFGVLVVKDVFDFESIKKGIGIF